MCVCERERERKRERERERETLYCNTVGKFPFLENRESFGKRQIISMFKYMI